jgi:phosphoribosylformylglycinamidine synthase
MQESIKSLIQNELINAAHDCADGGLFIALAEMSMPNDLGFDIVTDAEIREDAFLYGEAAGRVVVTVNEDNEDTFIEFMMKQNVKYTLLGHVTQGKMVVDDEHFGFVQEAKDIYDNALGKLIDA